MADGAGEAVSEQFDSLTLTANVKRGPPREVRSGPEGEQARKVPLCSRRAVQTKTAKLGQDSRTFLASQTLDVRRLPGKRSFLTPKGSS